MFGLLYIECLVWYILNVWFGTYWMFGLVHILNVWFGIFWMFGLVYLECLVWYILNVWFGIYWIFGLVYIECLVWYILNVWFGISWMFGLVYIKCLVWYRRSRLGSRGLCRSSSTSASSRLATGTLTLVQCTPVLQKTRNARIWNSSKIKFWTQFSHNC